MILFIAAISVFALVVLCKCIRINHQQHEMIVERLGRYCKTWNAGLHFLIPVIDRVVAIVSCKEQIIDIEPQAVITRDNCGVQVDVVVFYRVEDSYAYTYGVENAEMGIQNLVATTLRNIIGDLELDQTLSGRQRINTEITELIETPTRPWGLTILRAEIRNIRPPADVQNSMEKQLKSERDRRSAILTAEGEKQAAILVAEGNKEASIRTAEGDKEAMILRAEATSRAKKLEAEGEAAAIVSVEGANAQAISMINRAFPTAGTIKIEQLRAVERIASAPSSKTILPVEMGDLTTLLGLATSVKNAVVTDEQTQGTAQQGWHPTTRPAYGIDDDAVYSKNYE